MANEHSTPGDHPGKSWMKLEAYSPGRGCRQKFRVIGNTAGGSEPRVLHDETGTPFSMPSQRFQDNYDQIDWSK